jgi:hypothetical protein
MRLRGYNVQVNQTSPTLFLSHVLYLDLNNTFDSQRLWKNNSILCLSEFTFYKNFSADVPKTNQIQEEIYQDEIVHFHHPNTAELIESNNKSTSDQNTTKKTVQSNKNQWKIINKKIVSNLEKFNFSLIQSEQKGLEILLFKEVESKKEMNGKQLFLLELVIINFSNVQTFKGTRKLG